MAFVCSKELEYEDKILWASVLRRAVFDYVLFKGVRCQQIEWQKAAQYIFDEAKCEGGLSFSEVCELFNWDPDYLRSMTTRLCKDDVRRLKMTGIRDEFVYDTIKLILEDISRWKDGKAIATPFLPTRRLSKKYREALTPRPVKTNTRSHKKYKVVSPVVSWQVI